jgi:Xaa-Pro aminopeptidase
MYLSGFTGTTAYLLITLREAVLFTDSRYTEQAAAQTGGLFSVKEFKGDPLKTMEELIKDSGISEVLFEEYDLTFIQYSSIKEMLERADDLHGSMKRTLVPIGSLVNKIRMIKDEYETSRIKKAALIADRAFSHILDYIRPGVRESDIAAELEYFMKKDGASGESFDTITASGPRSSMPHATVSGRRISEGDPVILDYGAIFDSYCSDMTRTVFAGKPDDEMRHVYTIVLKAQEKALQKAVSGNECRIIDKAARDHITAAGYGARFGHGLGHGVGLEIHEAPRLSEFSIDMAADGMVATVEPGIYIPGKGGVRIEDMIIFNGSDPEIITKSIKEMLIL